jgi:hypothetical protein
MTIKRLGLLLVIGLLFLAFGCTEYGKVDQGRVVAFDREKMTLTMIRDKKIDTLKPDYTYLPPLTYSLPTELSEMGPDPKAGLRMKLDLEKNQVVLFDPASVSFKTIDYKLVDKKTGVERKDPLVFDAATEKAKKFPAIDKEKKTITIYSGRQKTLVVIGVPDEYMSLKESDWDAGDEVRIYYKQDGKSLRVMNITRTDIFKK